MQVTSFLPSTYRPARWRRVAAMLGMLAMLSQTLVLLIHRPASLAPADLAMTMTMGPDCPMVTDGTAGDAQTTEGQATEGQNAPDGSGKLPHKAPPVCPICQSLQLSSLVMLPVHAISLVVLTVVALTETTAAARLPETVTNERARSRAPPFRDRSTTIDG
jgi:hypothetical protein